MPPRTLVLILILLATGRACLFAQSSVVEDPYPTPVRKPAYGSAPAVPPTAMPAPPSRELGADLRDSLNRPGPVAPNTSASIHTPEGSLQPTPPGEPPAAAAGIAPNYRPFGGSPANEQEDVDSAPEPAGGLGSLLTVISSLTIVLGLFFVLVWFMRRASPNSQALLPSEVVEVLGRAPLSGRQQMHLLRVGSKLVLLSVTPDGAETLTEITDPDEVTRLTGVCRQTQGGSVTQAFRHVLGEFAGEQASIDESGHDEPSEKSHA